MGAQTQGRSDKDLITTRAIPEEVSTAEPDMDVTLAEALVDLLKSGRKKSPKPKARDQEYHSGAIDYRRKLGVKPNKSKLSSSNVALKLYYCFIRLMGRKASHVAVECTLQSHPNKLKGKSYEEIQKLFDKTYKPVNSFVPMASDDKENGSEKKAGGGRKKTLAKKRVGEKQSKESSKRQKMEDGAEKEELRAHLDVILGDDVAVSVESLATKYPIVDWKTHVLSEDKMYYEIIRANRSTKSYKIFIEMLDDFDRPFEQVKDDEVWKSEQEYNRSVEIFDSWDTKPYIKLRSSRSFHQDHHDVPQVFQNPPNIDPHMELFYTRQTKIINRQVQIRDEHRGGLSYEDVTTTPSPTTTSSSPTPPNAPSKTLSTNQTSSSQENTSSSFQSKLQISPPSSNEPTSPQPLNPLLDNISDVPPRPSNPQLLQSHPSLDITLSLSPITPLDHILEPSSPPFTTTPP
ncbi:DNA helicase PIF1-like protein [Tanacetum coccineum]